jgi:hypothetical protein
VIKRIAMTKVDPVLNYLDLILFNTLTPSIKLLNFPASRFSTVNFLHSLFAIDKKSPFFAVKNEIVNSIDAISQQKLLQKNMRELQVIFQHLDEHAVFQDMDKGFLQLILTMTNFVLKDLSVHLSVKEQGLKVT